MGASQPFNQDIIWSVTDDSYMRPTTVISCLSLVLYGKKVLYYGWVAFKFKKNL